MTSPVTLIIVASRPSEPQVVGGTGVADTHGLTAMAKNVIASGLPTMCLVPAEMSTLQLDLPQDCSVLKQAPVNRLLQRRDDTLARAVQATSDSRGWLFLSASAPPPTLSTILGVAEATLIHPLVVACHDGLPCHPIGFGPEFYSELLQLDSYAGVIRLLRRYPAHSVAVPRLS